ncbi:MAG: N-acetyltransferase [Planctomycetes bacterium]|nr:N-acetyltransferase [Planctomycetota bacterium]
MTRRLDTLDLAGALVRLRPHVPADAEPAFTLLAGEQEILRWLVWDGPASAAELADHYRTWRYDDGAVSDLRLAIEERASGALVGSLTMRFGGHPGQGDIGYWIGRAFQGRGFGREALALGAHLAFRHLGAQSLYAWVFVGNLASRRVLEHTAFTLSRTVPGRILKHKKAVDEWHYVLLANEWRRLRVDFRPAHEDLRWRDDLDALDEPARPFPSG